MSNSLQPHGLQDTRLPCSSLSHEVCSNSCPLSQWCHPAISSSIVPFSSFSQSFPASGSFLMSQLFTSGGQNIRATASASVLPKYIELISFRMDWFDIACHPRDSQESSSAPQFESNNSSALSLLYGPALTSIHDYCRNHSFEYTDLCQQRFYSMKRQKYTLCKKGHWTTLLFPENYFVIMTDKWAWTRVKSKGLFKGKNILSPG